MDSTACSLDPSERTVGIMSTKPFPPFSRPLLLSELEPFAKGDKRHCYIHPDDTNLCVKVPARINDKRCRAEQLMDLRGYNLVKKKWSKSVFDRIPTIQSVVDTDLGLGIVMQLYRDADGSISQNLLELIREKGLTLALAGAIGDLKQWLRQQRLVTRDTGAYNMVAVCLGEDEYKNRNYRGLGKSKIPLAGLSSTNHLRIT